MIYGFSVKNLDLEINKRPLEDSFYVDRENNIICVADGVTRDWDLNRDLKFEENYPNPSPARIVADIFCKSFCDFLKQKKQENTFNEVYIKDAFEYSNNLIQKWNQENISEPDYLLNDLAGCVSAGMVFIKDIVYWGYICDCGICIFDKDFNLKFKTKDEGPNLKHSLIWKDPRLINTDFNNPESRKILRKDYRNNLNEKNSFGVLTGEKSAMNYVKFGKVSIDLGDFIFIYSDGISDIIFNNNKLNSDFLKLLKSKKWINNFDKLRTFCLNRVGTEGTLVIFGKP